MTFQIILVVHVLLALGLVGLILIQHGKGADAGAAFGSGAAGSVFGARGAHSFLYKLTAILAIGFFVTSIVLLTLPRMKEPLLIQIKASCHRALWLMTLPTKTLAKYLVINYSSRRGEIGRHAALRGL